MADTQLIHMLVRERALVQRTFEFSMDLAEFHLKKARIASTKKSRRFHLRHYRKNIRSATRDVRTLSRIVSAMEMELHDG